MEFPPFNPRLIVRRERFTDVDDQIVALYARGLTTSEIQACLAEMYAVEVALDSVAAVIDGVAREVVDWQERPLEPMYPVVFFDALRVRIRDQSVVRTAAVYLAFAILPDGTRDILGLWLEQTQGSPFWRAVFTDLKTRGCRDIVIAVTDRPDGVAEALDAIFPETTLQTSVLQLIRHSLDFVTWKERKALAAALRTVYTAADERAALDAFEALASGPLGATIPTVIASWRRAWSQVARFFALPPEIRRVIYATNARETVRARLRAVIKTRGQFHDEDSVTTLLWLSLRTITAAWVRAPGHWKSARNQFAILYGDRFTQGEL